MSQANPSKDTLIPARVASITLEAEGVRSIDLVPVEGSLPAWTPGAHIEAVLPGGLVRHYSLFNGPEEIDRYRIAVKLEPGSRGGSSALHDLAVGDVLQIRAPRNLFPLDAKAKRHTLIAGGIGITPILSMFRELVAKDIPATLHYFARGRGYAAFAELLETHPARSSVHFHFGLDEAGTQARMHEVLAAEPVAATDSLYVCGPTPLMELATTEALSCGWPSEAVFRESFGAPAVSEEQHETEKSFEVVFQRSGKSCIVAPGQTIVAAAAHIGISFSTSCEQGFCGTCITDVVEGECDHRDGYLTKKEQAAGKQMMPCISRCKSKKLVLDA
ncbi:PDR/VanB family oxidoreductase [Uliginosibacterium sp. H3]|uniref:PDR/VanB family oxidoreductase n=1 Tax=Uliginosibacterium silvisoli TaxID=3114758 RepID=A0ABU6JYR2_9RHOO|nr:PDR/VanB family oxidoreductase [Uliginosibacterium sp. H3]